MAATEGPALTPPAVGGASDGEDEADFAAEAASEHAGEAAALFGIVEGGAEGIDVDGEVGFVLKEAPRILEGFEEEVFEPEPRGEGVGDAAGVVERRAGGADVGRDGRPEGGAVGAAADVEGPAGEALAGVVLAGAVQQGGAWREARGELAGEGEAVLPLAGAEGVGVPLGERGVIAGVEGGLAAHGEHDADLGEAGVGALAGGEERGPHRVVVGGGGAGLVTEAGHRHGEGHVGGAHVAGALDGRGEGRVRGARQRDVALAAEQAARGVEADPAAAGEVDLRPGVQVDDVVAHALGGVGDHPLVGELDEVAAHEAGREAARAEERDEQHGRVAAAPPALGEGLLRGPDAALFADDVADPRAHRLAVGDQERHRGALVGELGGELLEERPAREGGIREVEERGEIVGRLLRVGEGDLLGAVVEEEVERVDRADVHRQLHQDVEALDLGPLAEGHPRHVVARGILLPAQVAGLLDVEAVALDPGLGVVGRAEADDVGAERGRARVGVAAVVLDQESHVGRMSTWKTRVRTSSPGARGQRPAPGPASTRAGEGTQRVLHRAETAQRGHAAPGLRP